jgi:hypothetical protein
MVEMSRNFFTTEAKAFSGNAGYMNSGRVLHFN